MAEIPINKIQGAGKIDITTIILGASDTLTYNRDRNATLVIDNGSGVSLTPNIDGDGATTLPVRGYGTVDVSSGFTISSIANGEVVAIELETIKAFLEGAVTVTGGDGAKAYILEYV